MMNAVIEESAPADQKWGWGNAAEEYRGLHRTDIRPGGEVPGHAWQAGAKVYR